MEKNQSVSVVQVKGRWYCNAGTENWANDFFHAEGKTREEAIKKAIHFIQKDGQDLWLLENPILKSVSLKKVDKSE